MNAVRMQDGQVAVPILSAAEYDEHKKLGHTIEHNSKTNGCGYETPGVGGGAGWIPSAPWHECAHALIQSDRFLFRAVLPDYPPAKPKGFWAWLVALFA